MLKVSFHFKMSDEKETRAFHEFWREQPVIPEDFTDDILDGYIDPQIPVTSPPEKPSPLPAGFSFCNIDISDDKQLQEVYKFLSLNYVEDSQHKFRFCLSADLLKYALAVPGAIDDWVFGVRTKTGALAGFISGVPYTIRSKEDVQPWCSVNFLCVHSRLRAKKMAPVLIFELARRVRLHNVYRAVFTGSDVPSKPFVSASYTHRPLNLKKMSDCGFYPISPENLNSAKKRFALPQLVHKNIRPFCTDDIDGVMKLFNDTSSKFKYDIQMTPELVNHMFTPRENTIYSYVIPSSSGIQAFFSFYMMDWSILDETARTLTQIRAAYVYYWATASVDLKNLVADLLNKAVNDAHADIINAIVMAGLGDALTAHKFEVGSRALQYYSYNFAVPPFENPELRFCFI